MRRQEEEKKIEVPFRAVNVDRKQYIMGWDYLHEGKSGKRTSVFALQSADDDLRAIWKRMSVRTKLALETVRK